MSTFNFCEALFQKDLCPGLPPPQLDSEGLHKKVSTNPGTHVTYNPFLVTEFGDQLATHQSQSEPCPGNPRFFFGAPRYGVGNGILDIQ